MLEGKRFTHGLFEEFLDAFPVMPREGVVRTFLVEDGNLITAHGGAFREFAAVAGQKVGLDCPETVFSGMAGQDYTEDDFIFHLPPEEMAGARDYWDKCLEEAHQRAASNDYQ